MARRTRFECLSEGDFYHITARGAGRRTIFDDDVDRKRYVSKLFKLMEDSSGDLLAWCLMGNHAHLLFRMELHELSALIHRLHTSYSLGFNGRHGHVGPVFQGRYDCRAVQSEKHLLLAVKYIHLNPADIADVDWRTYAWSSYRGYLDGSSRCDTEFMLDLLGGAEGFKRFHEENETIREIRLDGYRPRLSDAEAAMIMEQRYGRQFADVLALLPKEKRDAELAVLHDLGLSGRQIERLTGIGRNIVNRAISG